MQIYKTPMGTRYIVVDGLVYFKPVDGSPVRRSLMTVSRFLYLIERGLMRFDRTIKPIMLKRY